MSAYVTRKQSKYFPVSFVLSNLLEISDHGDTFIIANCLTETPEYFEVYS